MLLERTLNLRMKNTVEKLAKLGFSTVFFMPQ